MSEVVVVCAHRHHGVVQLGVPVVVHLFWPASAKGSHVRQSCEAWRTIKDEKLAGTSGKAVRHGANEKLAGTSVESLWLVTLASWSASSGRRAEEHSGAPQRYSRCAFLLVGIRGARSCYSSVAACRGWWRAGNALLARRVHSLSTPTPVHRIPDPI